LRKDIVSSLLAFVAVQCFRNVKTGIDKSDSLSLAPRIANLPNMAETFSALGVPFPLFEAPIDETIDYGGVGACSLCRKKGHYFTLGIGCAILTDCPACGTQNGLRADDRADRACRNCAAIIPFPPISGAQVKICYECLRAGRGAITKDTELGMISWDQAFEGVTHGIPGLNRDDFEMVPREDGWFGARLPQEMMFELLRTPTYSTIQGDCWQFCCQMPMIYIGNWGRDDFLRHASDGDGQRLFEEIVNDRLPGFLLEDLHEDMGIYVFRCPSCSRLRSHWDFD
jgi:uncharacterized protein CbrC (UPF0167 family)